MYKVQISFYPFIFTEKEKKKPKKVNVYRKEKNMLDISVPMVYMLSHWCHAPTKFGVRSSWIHGLLSIVEVKSNTKYQQMNGYS